MRYLLATLVISLSVVAGSVATPTAKAMCMAPAPGEPPYRCNDIWGDELWEKCQWPSLFYKQDKLIHRKCRMLHLVSAE